MAHITLGPGACSRGRCARTRGRLGFFPQIIDPVMGFGENIENEITKDISGLHSINSGNFPRDAQRITCSTNSYAKTSGKRTGAQQEAVIDRAKDCVVQEVRFCINRSSFHSSLARDRYIGATQDLSFAWHLDRHTALQFVGAYYEVGPYLRETPPSAKDATYFSVTANFC